MKIWAACGLVLGILVLTACGPGGVFEDSSQKATREAQEAVYEQTIVFVQTQASTITALELTAESAAAMGTQIVQLGAQNQSLQATIDAAYAGVPPGQVQPAPPAGQPNQPAQPGGGSTPLFPNTSGITPTGQNTTGTVYVDATTATGVRNSDGCAVDSVSVFDTGVDQIYIVVLARNVQPGTEFHSRWLHNGQTQFETVSWTPNRAFNEVCIWFYIESADVDFSAGNWSVELLANGLSVISRSFRIGAADAGQIITTPTGGDFIGDQSNNAPQATEPLGQ